MQWDGVHALVERAKQGDKQSWAQLCLLAEPYLIRRAEKLLGPGWRQRSVPDLVSKTWLQALQGLDSFVGGKDDAVAKTKAKVPDAIFVSPEEVHEALLALPEPGSGK